MRTLSALVVVPSLFALVAACSSAGPEQEPTSQSTSAIVGDAPQHLHLQKGVKDAHHGGGGGGGVANLSDHGGAILTGSTTYAIWWGAPSGFPADAQTGVDSLFDGLNGSHFFATAQQYMRGSGLSTVFHENLVDSSSSPPSRSPSTSTIVTEACNVISANGLKPDSSAIYFVFTSNFPGGHVNYCAWHSYGTCNGTTIQVAYMPNTSGISGCDPGADAACATTNQWSQGTQSLLNVTSHEFMESVTDPDISAWYDSSGSEIGDKCAWTFGPSTSPCAELSNGSYHLQQEWSNAANGCVQNTPNL